jgi:hypothetical protein
MLMLRVRFKGSVTASGTTDNIITESYAGGLTVTIKGKIEGIPGILFNVFDTVNIIVIPDCLGAI